MSIFEAIILGLVQGLTEFIPVSSSGHLVLLHEVFGITENGLQFDVALHVGTLLALVIFFKKDITALARGLFVKNDHSKISRFIIVATVPAVIVGILLQDAAEGSFRSQTVVASTLFIGGVLMLLVEWWAKTHKPSVKLKQTSLKQALLMGVAQAAAIIPGVSRSGITITTGLFTGLTRVAATRFSFLLAIPITFGAILKVLFTDGTSLEGEWSMFAVGIATAFISGLFAIKFLLRFLAKHTLKTFAYYRIGLAFIIALSLII